MEDSYAPILSLVNKYNNLISTTPSSKISEYERDLLIKYFKDSVEKNTSTESYLLSLFNLCVLHQNYGSDDFVSYLNILNQFLNSDLLNDSEADSDFFYYVGTFNFSIHNYLTAKEYFEKSITLETLDKTKKTEEEIYISHFNKICRKAYCLEYLEKPNEAIIELIGFNINIISCPLENIIREIISLYDRCKDILNNPYQLLIRVYESNLILIGSCNPSNLFSYIHKSIKGGQPTNLQEDNARELVHILSHCMSEYCIQVKKDSKVKNGEKIITLYTRLSELLMKSLGDKYVTCYSTLKAENYDYVTAIFELNRVKNALQRNVNIDNTDKVLAEINFYIWYFSLIANYDIENNSKTGFNKYCKQTKDLNSRVYYELFNFRSLLKKNFDDLRSWILNSEFSSLDSDQKKLEASHTNFKKFQPTKCFHKEIIDEWNNLNNLYDIFTICKKLSQDNSDPQHINCKALLDLWSTIRTNPVFLSNSKRTINDIDKRSNVFQINLQFGKFLYIGDYDTIIDLSKKAGADFYLHNQALNSEALQNNSNILILKGDCNTELENIINIVARSSNKLNIFIKEDIVIHTSDDLVNIFMCKDIETIITITMIFAITEECISNLHKAFNSYVISPITDGDTYSYQGCEQIKLLTKDYPINVNNIRLNWKNHFEACYNDSKNAIVKRKSWSSKGFPAITSFIIYIQSKTPMPLAYIYHTLPELDISYADGIKLYNGAAIMKEISDFYSYRKNRTKKCHSDCTIKDCPTCFLKIEDKETNSEAIRSWLYSSTGVDIKQGSSLLLKNLSADRTCGDDFVFCIFNENIITTESDSGNTKLHKSQLQKSLCSSIDRISLESYTKYKIERRNAKDINNKCIQTRCQMEQPFIFISYRSKSGSDKLCSPVYCDCQKLNKKNYNFWIAINDATGNFISDIERAIENENCQGAMIYLTKEYLDWNDDADICFQEVKKINKRVDNFSKILILVDGLTNNDIVKIINDPKNVGVKYNELVKLFDYNAALRQIQIITVIWDSNLTHIKEGNYRNIIERFKKQQ